MTLYKNKYRIESARCPKWDYTSNGYYFVTICTYNKHPFFGEIINGEMVLNLISEIVAVEWQKTEEIRPNIKLDAWVIMPNHLHGIVIIDKTLVETTRRVVSTHRNVSTDKTRLQSNSLGSIIGQFKSVCTKQIWAAGYTDFRWQSRFHDHIIRDEEALNQIREYIINNPMKWEEDEHHPANFNVRKFN
ncbi:transposase [Anabaena sphaerica FACHB-251]|uniref:Transposase n=1 Tax=Anabaena sphaerica FACHB-251 TaxID=2692883 RepID=A0A927A2C1_9NOST|nr:transposase [Anabaena sphaerica]MBD2295253.1 transposase [Anabaena sphaerica FACHB-251]